MPFREDKYGSPKYVNGIDGEIDPVPLEDAHTHWLAGRACRRLEELAGVNAANQGAYVSAARRATDACAVTNGPWHLRVDFTEPHPPYRPCAEFADIYDPAAIPAWDSFYEDFKDKPYIQKQMLYTWGLQDYDWARWAPIAARYYAYVSQLDDAVGKILDALERSGCADNTLVVLTADHGDMCGAHRMIDKHNVMYDDIVRVPLLIKWPGAIPADTAAGAAADTAAGATAGTEINAFVQNTLDIGPTFLEAAGLPASDNADGRSLFPLFGGDTPAGWRDCAVSSYNGQQFGLYTQRMLRDNDWKYVWNTSDVDELYDLHADPAELVNRAHDPACGGVLRSMRKRLHDVLLAEGDGLLKNYWLRNQLLGITQKL
jgi:arylsulfatase A-like enzyme